MSVQKVLVTVAEAAEMLSLSRAAIYELAAKGELTKRYVGRGSREFRLQADEVVAYANSMPTEPRGGAV